MSSVFQPCAELPAVVAAVPAGAGRWLGWTSCGLFALTVCFILGCLIQTRRAQGWSKLSYVVIAAIGSWIGCGLGALIGLAGLAFQEADNAPAVVGTLLNVLVGGGPWVAFQVKRARGRRQRMSS